MLYFSRLTIVLLSTLLLGGCAAVKIGHDFDAANFAAKIEQGVTTQNTVRTWLGEPTGVGVSMTSDGEIMDEWTYYFAEGRMHDMSSARIKILQVRFDKSGKVRAYNWTASKH